MLVTDFITSVRYTLQDTNKNRWKDTEILDYINEGMRDAVCTAKILNDAFMLRYETA